MHDTIRDNLLWARPSALESDLMETLRLASADQFVLALSHGLDTVVGIEVWHSQAASDNA